MARVDDIKVRLDLPDDQSGYAYSSSEVLDVIDETEGLLYLAFLARLRGGNLTTIVLTKAAAARLCDELTRVVGRS